MSPESIAHLAELLAARNRRAEKISAIDLRQLDRVLELVPEDMTVTVESGITLGRLQRELASHGQWLPIDPPNPDDASIHAILSRNLSGPRRFGCGTIREHLLGMKVVLADGRVIKSGAKVVKNVAGYDLAKLFIGARDTLGIIVEATFKVQPVPEAERIVSASVAVADLPTVVRDVLDSSLAPVIFDVHRLANSGAISVVLGFAGTRADVDAQLDMACALGFVTAGTLEYETRFWIETAPVNRLSVLPSKVAETIASLGPIPFIARAGNGLLCFRGAAPGRTGELPLDLMRRVKNAYDPRNILPELVL